jgi:hypothetical protein
MSIFRSQFERARAYSDELAGDARDPAWRSPTVIAAVVGGGAAVAAAAIPVVAGGDDKPQPSEKPAGGEENPPGEQAAWGEGWDAGWEAPASPAPAAADGGSSWMDRGEYTDAGVGGDEDFFYFVDGDSSAAFG